MSDRDQVIDAMARAIHLLTCYEERDMGGCTHRRGVFLADEGTARVALDAALSLSDDDGPLVTMREETS